MKRYTAPLLIGIALVFVIWSQVALVDGGVWRTRSLIGLAIIVPSFLLWMLARQQLGDSFTARAEARRLVTHGLYARIRNPIYFFAECMALGIIIFLGRPLLLLVWVAAIVYQIGRARKERRVLEDAFGDEYRRYRSQTWF
ncbi:MAG TPA: isoprenylcysteine carboxylmethyltransferase family protein [Gemmatimonadaceae bacterium]